MSNMENMSNNKKIIILILIASMILIMGMSVLFMGMNLNTEVKINGNLKGDITFVSNRTDKGVEIEALIKEFEEIHPNVNVNLELIGDAQSILQRKASVGELPDITLVPSTISKSEYRNYFLPLDDLGFDDSNIYNYFMGTGNDYNLYCLNTSITWQGVIYNKDIFKEANIDSLPTTINELFEACSKIEAIGVTPIAVNYRQSWTMDLWADVIPHLFDNNLSNDVMNEDKEIMDSNGGMYKSLNLVREIVKRGYAEEDLFNYDWQQFKNDMSEGKIAMAIWNSDFICQLEDMGMNIDSLGMFPIPETSVIKIYGDYMYAVSNNTDNPETAKEFLKFIFEDNRYANAVNIMSPLKDDMDTKEVLEKLGELNIPIITYSDYISRQSSEAARLEDEFLQIKKELGIDAAFVQRFIIDDDIDRLINDINLKWDEMSKQKDKSIDK